MSVETSNGSGATTNGASRQIKNSLISNLASLASKSSPSKQHSHHQQQQQAPKSPNFSSPSRFNSSQQATSKQTPLSPSSHITSSMDIKVGSDVTAIVRYDGRVDEHELSFDYGDLIKIIKIIQKDPQWALGELRGKQGYISLTCVKPRSVTMP